MEMAGSKQSTGGGRMRAAALPPKATINDNQEDRPHKKSCDQPRQNFEQNEKKSSKYIHTRRLPINWDGGGSDDDDYEIVKTNKYSQNKNSNNVKS